MSIQDSVNRVLGGVGKATKIASSFKGGEEPKVGEQEESGVKLSGNYLNEYRKILKMKNSLVGDISVTANKIKSGLIKEQTRLTLESQLKTQKSQLRDINKILKLSYKKVK